MSKKHSIFSRYVGHIRRSPKHMQQVHAVAFAGGVTCLLAMCILYFDYGFWHEQYLNSDTAKEQEKIAEKSESPLEMLSHLTQDAKDKLTTIKSSSSTLFEGKKTYSNKEKFLSSTSTDDGIEIGQ